MKKYIKPETVYTVFATESMLAASMGVDPDKDTNNNWTREERDWDTDETGFWD